MTDDVLTWRMAGPAIRAWQIAEALAPDHDVVLATTSPTCERSSDTFRTEACSQERFAELERWCTVVLFQGYVLNHVPVLRDTDRVMVVDLYDPIHLEALELNTHRPEPERSVNVASAARTLGEQLQRGDYFVCASDKQRDLWLGFLSAAGRVNPTNYAADPSLRRLIDVVAFGLSDRPPAHTRQAIKGLVPGIAEDDEVVLWGGGVYDWLDPVTAIRAVDLVRQTRPQVRLFFLGTRHPNPAIEEARTLVAARMLADDLGLTGKHVFFNDDWVAYEDRPNYLLEADVAISLHVEHIEASYSFRTRVLDYLWAGLPVVATQGDTFADLISRHGVGTVVPGGDHEAVAAALSSLLGDGAAREACRQQSTELAHRFVWSEVLRPLISFCARPSRAPDQESLLAWPAAPPPPPPPPPPASAPPPAPPSTRFDRLSLAYRRGGVTDVIRSSVRVARQRARAGTRFLVARSPKGGR